MVDPSLRRIPEGVVDVTVPQPVDALAAFPPDDPAWPSYRVIANNRQPVALRDIMIAPVRSGYIGDDGPRPDPSLNPPSGAEAVPGVDVSQVYLPVDGGVARCQLYRPAGLDGPLPAVVYFHGGGFTLGASEDTDYIARQLSRDLDALVVSANYRLAPEHPFPAPLDDCMGVYRFVVEQGERIDADRRWIATAGDSAGSNFAAALPLRARDEGVRVPDAVIMLGAFTDFQAERYESFQRQAPIGIVYDSAFFGFIRGAYLTSTPWNHPWASPIEGDLADYPPSVVVAGTHDPIVDSARAFAAKLEQSGGTAATYFPDGMPHGFYFFPGVHAEGEVAFALVRDTLRPLLPPR